MKPKTIKILYWVTTIFVALFTFMDGIGGVTRQQAGIDVMNHLGYPIYFLSIVGVAKLLGTIAIVQNRFQTIKEWAYAGFTFNFIGGAASRAFVGDTTFEIVFPIIALGILFIPYFFWKKLNQIEKS